MAESVAPKDETPLYNYELIERYWTGYVRRNRSRHCGTSREYFNNFARNHRSFEFSITKTYDGTSQVMVDREMYFKMKKELEQKTSSTLPDINALDMSTPSNVVQQRKTFASQNQFSEFKQCLEEENNKVRASTRKKASEHRTMLLQELTSNDEEKTFVAYDLEMYDRDRKSILEVGSVKFTLKKDDHPEYFHAIVKENLHLVNSNITDNRDKFAFGTSQRMSLEEAAAQLQEVIDGADFLVVHAGSNEEKYLKDNDINVAEKITFDTQILALDLLTARHPNMLCWGLKRMLENMGISFKEDILHNAANDAHYTMLAFKKLVEKAKNR